MSIVMAGFILAVGFGIGGFLIALRANGLRRAMQGREGVLLMTVISRMTWMMVSAMWLGVLRQFLVVVDEAGTVETRTIIQAVSSIVFLAAIVWALVQVRSFDNRTTDRDEDAENKEPPA